MTAKHRETLCFLHGWGIDSRVWKAFVKGFVPEWNVKILPLPGYDGAVPCALGMEEVARKVISEIPDGSVLIGWSLGGMLGIRIATMKSIRQLVLVAATPCFVKKDDWPCGTEAEIIEGLEQRLRGDTKRTLQEFALLCSKGDRGPRATYRVLARLLEDNNTHIKALLDGLEMLLHTDLRGEFSGLKCRVGAVLAARDKLVPVVAGVAMQSLRTGVDLRILEDAGHVPFISRPEQVRKSLHSMLEAGSGDE